MSVEGSGIWLIKDVTRENIRKRAWRSTNRGWKGKGPVRTSRKGIVYVYGMFSYVPRSEPVFTRFLPPNACARMPGAVCLIFMNEVPPFFIGCFGSRSVDGPLSQGLKAVLANHWDGLEGFAMMM